MVRSDQELVALLQHGQGAEGTLRRPRIGDAVRPVMTAVARAGKAAVVGLDGAAHVRAPGVEGNESRVAPRNVHGAAVWTGDGRPSGHRDGGGGYTDLGAGDRARFELHTADASIFMPQASCGLVGADGAAQAA